MSAWKSALPQSVKSGTGLAVSSGVQAHSTRHVSPDASASFSSNTLQALPISSPSHPASRLIDSSVEPEAPLIISTLMDSELSDYFTQLRTRFFPRHRNHLTGHLTLFHALPGNQQKAVEGILQEMISSMDAISVHSRKPILREGPRSSTVMIPLLESSKINGIRSLLLSRFQSEKMDLTQQDQRSRIMPHITIANKCSEDYARKVMDELAKLEQQPKSGEIIGLDLWFYRNGPWQHIKSYKFAESNADAKQREASTASLP